MALTRKDGTLTPEPTCYETNSQAHGINFHLSNGRALFASATYLSHVELSSDSLLTFHYSFGKVDLRGQNLQQLYSYACDQNLAEIFVSQTSLENAPYLSSVIFEAANAI